MHKTKVCNENPYSRIGDVCSNIIKANRQSFVHDHHRGVASVYQFLSSRAESEIASIQQAIKLCCTDLALVYSPAFPSPSLLAHVRILYYYIYVYKTLPHHTATRLSGCRVDAPSRRASELARPLARSTERYLYLALAWATIYTSRAILYAV